MQRTLGLLLCLISSHIFAQVEEKPLESAELFEEKMVECAVAFPTAPTPIDGLYQVFRFGDSIFARYRHAPERDLLQTDDVMVKRYQGEDLEELGRSGLLDRLVASADTSRAQVQEVVLYAIDETNPDARLFEMNIYRLFAFGNISLGRVARFANGTDDLMQRCR